MSIFGNLLGRKGQASDETARKQQFDDEWVEAFSRFGIVTGLGTINLDLKHPKTGRVMTPHEGLGQTFNEWKAIGAPYDRRALLYDAIYNIVGRSMNRWATANYLSAVRSPQRAITLLEQADVSEADSPRHQAASAWALLNLGRPVDALGYARQAAEAVPEDARLQTLFADALHLNGQCEEAHTIYSGLMVSAASIPDTNAPVSLMFTSLFSQETGVVPSPILAVDMAGQMSDPAQVEEFWQLGENEFYDSAYFRMHNAYHLADTGSMERGFAKLIALVKEMPWLREPSLNLIQFFDKMDPTGQKIMPEFQTHLRQTIAKNGWTIEGMNKMALGQNR